MSIKQSWRGYSYTWEGDRLVHLVTSNRVGDTGNYTTDETMHFHYDAQGKPSMLMYNGTRFGYVYNAQGDVIGIITGGLTEKVKYTYDAWGRLLSITGSSANTIGKANPFRYRAYIYDQECGLYYLRTRYYNPNWCRFINADTNISGNLFCYCNNNPIASSDRDGKDPGTSYMYEISLGDYSNNDPLQNEFIYYDVPLYSQGNTKLCWAYSQLMIESYQSGVVLNSKEAKTAAIELGKAKNGEKDWNKPDWPSNLGSSYTVNDIEDIFIALKQQNGPVYAYYEGKNSSHLVVVTGVDVRNDVVYTNNPWGTRGEQTFSQFSKGPAKKIYDIVPKLI